MALLTMFVNKPKKTEFQRKVGEKTVAITMDAQLSEDFEADAEATVHPIENGAPVTDHMILKPMRLTITGIVSATPLTIGSSLAGLGSAGGAVVGSSLASKLGGQGLGALGSVAGAVGGGLAAKSLAGLLDSTGGQASQGNERLETTISELINARDSMSPIVVQTGLKKYGDSVTKYVIVSVKVSRDNKDGRKIKVTVGLQQIITATTQSQTVSVPKILSGVPNSDLGRKGAGTLDEQKGKGASIAYGLLFGSN